MRTTKAIYSELALQGSPQPSLEFHRDSKLDGGMGKLCVGGGGEKGKPLGVP